MSINTTYGLLFQINSEFNLTNLMNIIAILIFTFYMLQYIYSHKPNNTDYYYVTYNYIKFNSLI
jgi:hypothetical protein